MTSKDLHGKVLCHPFHYFEDEYTSPYIPGEPTYRHPTAGTSSYLNFLWRDMVFARRIDALKCRNYMLRCLYADGRHTFNSSLGGYNSMYRENAQNILVNKLLSNISLRLLLKNKQPTWEEKKDTARLYSMVDALCTGVYLKSKYMQFRYWRTFPLYDIHSKIMELVTASAAAERVGAVDGGVEHGTGTDDARNMPAIQRRSVILILRPASRYLTVEPGHCRYPRQDEDEKVLCKASVVLTKTEAESSPTFQTMFGRSWKRGTGNMFYTTTNAIRKFLDLDPD
ncbi:hypothetical protein BJY01DRAFT_202353 [Aspergillus pseudoustus]|uniref:Uncharacterized protein n=1 Tax=Aspergillus pseudoustus TaxID=1810923 RepID=A0ABR4KZZ0_9EURO